MRTSVPSIAQTTLLSGVPIGAFNGGKSQVNFNFVQSGGEFPFLNILKSGQAWSFFNNASAPVTPDMLDSNGYPTTITNTGLNTVCFAPTVTERPGNYIVMLFGEGTVICTGSGTLTSSAGVWTRFVVNTNSSDGRIVFVIRTRGVSSYISNAAMFHADDEAKWLAGEQFGTQFLAVLRQAKFGVLRFLNWQNGNTTNITTWATRKPLGYVFYSGYEARNSIYAGPTTNVGNAYSVSFPGFALVDKSMVTIVFNASATQSGMCSLNVNGTGDINLLSQSASALSVAGNSYPIGGDFHSMATCMYDATLNAWLKLGGDAASNSQGIVNGVPPEVMVQLCAEVGAHPYFISPPFAVDPMTDYHTHLATFVKNYSSWMIPRFEGCNELWNTLFNQTGYANAKTAAYISGAGWAGGSSFHDWQGKTISTIGQAVNAIYGGAVNGTKYQVLCGVQTATFVSTGAANGSSPRLASTQYLAQSTAAQSGYTKSSAATWATHVCCAQYITPSEYGTGQEVTDAAAYAAAAGNAPLQLQIATSYADTLAGAASGFNLAATNITYGFVFAWAQGFTNSSGAKIKMCGYEGGYSPSFTGNTQLDNLREASKFVNDIGAALIGGTFVSGAVVAGTYIDFVNAGGEFPSCFQLGGNQITGGAWSVLDPDIYVSPQPAQWNAIVAFNH